MLQNQHHFITIAGLWFKTSDYRYTHTGVYKCTRCLIPNTDSRDVGNEKAISCTRQWVPASGSTTGLWAPVTALGVEAPSPMQRPVSGHLFDASFKTNLSQAIQSCPPTSWPYITQSTVLALSSEESVKWFRNPSQCWPCSVLQQSMLS